MEYGGESPNEYCNRLRQIRLEFLRFWVCAIYRTNPGPHTYVAAWFVRFSIQTRSSHIRIRLICTIFHTNQVLTHTYPLDLYDFSYKPGPHSHGVAWFVRFSIQTRLSLSRFRLLYTIFRTNQTTAPLALQFQQALAALYQFCF